MLGKSIRIVENSIHRYLHCEEMFAPGTLLRVLGIFISSSVEEGQ